MKKLMLVLLVMSLTYSMQPDKKDADYYLQISLYTGKMFLLKLANSWEQICKEDLQRAKYYLLMGVDVNSTDEVGNSALILSTIHSHSKLVSLLLQQKADKDYEDKCELTALGWAKELKNETMIKLLENS